MSRKISNALMGCIASLFAAFAHGALVDTDGNLATNQTLLGDIDMGVGTLGDLKDYVSPSQITDGTNTIDAVGNVWEEFTGWTFSDGKNHVVYKAYDSDYSPDRPWGLYIDTTDLGPGISWYETEAGRDAVTSFTDTRFDPPITATYATTTNYVGKLALTNEIPQVVAPSTNAVKGTAADARATGMAIYTGFTEWVCVPSTYNEKTLHVERENDEWNLYADDQFLDPPESAPDDTTSLTFSVYGVTATRHLITPTKTSQLTNDGSNGVPFAVVSQIPLNYETVSNMAMSAVSTNALEGQTYDFSKNYDIIKATADLIRLFGGTVTNDPTANGGN